MRAATSAFRCASAHIEQSDDDAIEVANQTESYRKWFK